LLGGRGGHHDDGAGGGGMLGATFHPSPSSDGWATGEFSSSTASPEPTYSAGGGQGHERSPSGSTEEQTSGPQDERNKTGEPGRECTDGVEEEGRERGCRLGHGRRDGIGEDSAKIGEYAGFDKYELWELGGRDCQGRHDGRGGWVRGTHCLHELPDNEHPVVATRP